MRSSTILTGLAAIVPVLAQRPANESICSYYTTALLTNNTGANQYTLLTLLVNTAVIGNYTTPNVGIKVPGILTPGTYNGTAVNLLPYFDGALKSTNNDGTPVAVNFLDGGGATPLEANMAANSTTSAQYTLLTHLYQYFGVLLGCTASGFPAYAGDGSMASVHRYMDLSSAEVGYFIEQVGLSAASFGVASADVTAVGDALTTFFDYRCSPPTTIVPSQGAQLQSICLNSDCPLAPNATCDAYPVESSPAAANSTSNSTSSTATSTSATASASFTGAAAKVAALGAGLLGLAAYAL